MALGNKEVMGRNIQKHMDLNGVSRTKLSKDLGVSYSTISDWINGKTYPRIDKIEMLADYFGIEKSNLVENPHNLSNIIEVSQVKSVPIISEVACGQPIFAEDNYDDSIPYSVDLLPSGKVFFVKAVGDSMEPTIKPDELVLVREQDVVENGEIACVVFEAEGSYATLKRLRKQDGRVMLMPDNTNHLPYELKEGDNVRILGKAVFVIK